jgi:hypothetical protein
VNPRLVLPELLDVLPPQAAPALRSRRDLRRLNAWMRHPQIMARALADNLPGAAARRLVELGAGDGHFLWSVAKRLNGLWPGTQAVLVDQLEVLDPQIWVQFHQTGWRVRAEVASATDWLRAAPPRANQVILGNLFFHHFRAESLAELLRLAANSASLLVALEPRRSGLSRVCGRLLWAIGCGPVTRHDARVSIRAGFAAGEISALWPDPADWELTERPAGLFSHLFIARRKETSRPVIKR